MIYFDNASTTRIDERILEFMIPFFKNYYSNPSSSHNFGFQTKKYVDKAREQISQLINCSPKELLFTSGATEAINLGLKGFSDKNQEKGRHIITVSSEHKAVLETCKYIETIGYEVTYLPVKKDGLIDIEVLKSEIRDDTILVSVMYVNNETGVIQDIKNIANIVHEFGISLFCDATQAVGKIPVNVIELGIDLMSFSAHKFHGPKGIGALYINNNIKNLTPIIHGGGQEHGLRSGTLNVPGIIGLGMACEISFNEMDENRERISILKDKLEMEMLKYPKSFINGNSKNRIYNITNICFPGIDVNKLIGTMKQVALSNGSACTSNTIESSHVLKSMGLSNEDAYSSIRFSLGKFNNQNEIITLSELFHELTNNKLFYA